jgi:hypothetical protein
MEGIHSTLNKSHKTGNQSLGAKRLAKEIQGEWSPCCGRLSVIVPMATDQNP